MPGGLLLVAALMLPVAGLVLIVALRLKRPERVALPVLAFGLAAALSVAAEIWRSEAPVRYALGGWAPPLGVSLAADGLSAALMVMSASILLVVGFYARGSLMPVACEGEARRPTVFWVMLLGIAAAMSAVLLAQDLFSLFVALELLTFSAVALVGLDGSRETLLAALRYLVFALVGSALYLLGAALLYGAYGALDIATLHELARPDQTTATAFGLMIAGLTAKAALFPLHLWLPPAHAGAPAPASAVLSALVVKAPFFLILRLWFDVAPQPVAPAAGQLMAILGASSILFCGVVALRQARLKMMIAYSTVAQVGYLFLLFPLVLGAEALAPWTSIAWSGGVLQLVSHAFAKAAMFLAAGVIADVLGHDRIDDLGGAAGVAPISVAAFALAGLSLMGLPPAGGFVAKVMLLNAAVESDDWWIAATILAGGLLAAGYVFRVVGRALAAPVADSPCAAAEGPRSLAVLALALIAVLLGFLPLQPFAYLGIGREILP